MIESVRALLQFTTVLPLGRPAEFDAFADRSYLYPLSGYVTGGIAGLAAAAVPNPSVGAAVGLAAVLLVTGAHHFDGLLDLGDGLMAHGGSEVRVRALLDRQVGAGGIALGMTVLLLAYAGLSSSPSLLWALLLAEVLGRFGMALLTIMGVPFREGIQSYLHARSRPGFILPAALLCLPLALVPLPVPALLGSTVVAVLVPLAVLALGRRLFGGVNGDLVGASHELCRAAVVCAVALLA